jgi:hypothetical protein
MSQATLPSKALEPVSRSRYVRVKALLAVTLTCVVGLSAAVVSLATSGDTNTTAGVVPPPPLVTNSDYRGDPFTSNGGQTGSASSVREGRAGRCVHYFTMC